MESVASHPGGVETWFLVASCYRNRDKLWLMRNLALTQSLSFIFSFSMTVSPLVRESKTVLNCRFHAVNSGFQVLDFGFFVSGTWISDFIREWNSGFLELYSDSKAYASGLWIPLAKISRIPESGFPHIGRSVYNAQWITKAFKKILKRYSLKTRKYP